MGKLIDLTGRTFGRLTVVSRAENKPNDTRARWYCRCSCGKEATVMGYTLRRGESKSCGCLHAEIAKTANTHHGGCGTRLFRVWLGMTERCRNVNHNRYANYGGRGITVCAEWRNFAKFRDWALANGYDASAKHGDCTIDRIDNDVGYCPENCKWTDAKTQSNNRRKTTNIKRKAS